MAYKNARKLHLATQHQKKKKNDENLVLQKWCVVHNALLVINTKQSTATQHTHWALWEGYGECSMYMSCHKWMVVWFTQWVVSKQFCMPVINSKTFTKWKDENVTYEYERIQPCSKLYITFQSRIPTTIPLSSILNNLGYTIDLIKKVIQ